MFRSRRASGQLVFGDKHDRTLGRSAAPGFRGAGSTPGRVRTERSGVRASVFGGVVVWQRLSFGSRGATRSVARACPSVPCGREVGISPGLITQGKRVRLPRPQPGLAGKPRRPPRASAHQESGAGRSSCRRLRQRSQEGDPSAPRSGSGLTGATAADGGGCWPSSVQSNRQAVASGLSAFRFGLVGRWGPFCCDSGGRSSASWSRTPSRPRASSSRPASGRPRASTASSSGVDLILEVAWEKWRDLNPVQRQALVDQQLCGVWVDTDSGAIHLKGPDFHGYLANLRRYRLWNDGLQKFEAEARQLKLFGAGGRPTEEATPAVARA